MLPKLFYINWVKSPSDPADCSRTALEDESIFILEPSQNKGDSASGLAAT